MTHPAPTHNERLSSLVLGLLAAFCILWLGLRHTDKLYILFYSPSKEWTVYSVTLIPNRMLAIQCSAMLLGIGLVLLTLVWWKRASKGSSVWMELWRWFLNIVACLVIMLTLLALVGTPLNSPTAWIGFGVCALAALFDIWRRRKVSVRQGKPDGVRPSIATKLIKHNEQ